MKLLVVVLSILLSTSMCYAEARITDKELKHGIVTSILMVVDMQYSLDMTDNPNINERNPYFGKYPSQKEFYQGTGVGLIALWGFIYYVDENYSVPCLDFLSGIELTLIDHHIHVGLNMEF